MAGNLDKGRAGELAAVKLLQEKGHVILFENYRWQHKEIDVISQDGDVLVFTEVKTRTNFNYGYPEAAVDERKQAHMKAAAEMFLLDHPQYQKLRFDTIGILMHGNQVKEIVHWEAAFY